MLGRYSPVFAPSLGSSPAAVCSAAVATPCRRLCSAMVGGLPSPPAQQSSSPTRWFPVSPCSRLSPSGRVRWFPAPRLPEVPLTDWGRWFPAPQLSRQLRRPPTHWPMGRLRCCSPSSRTAASLSRCRHVSAPSYPWTLELRLGRHAAIAWNAPGLASPSSLVETGDQSVLKRLFSAFEAPLLSPPSGML
jgi:hypothetical protein